MSLSPPLFEEQDPPTSPVYIPVYFLYRPEGDKEKTSAATGPTEILFGPAIQLAGCPETVEVLANEVDAMGLTVDTGHPISGLDTGGLQDGTGIPEAVAGVTNIFPAPPAPALLPPPARHPTPRVCSVSAEPSRRSARQASIKTVVPVAQRATHRLILQLDLAGTEEPIGDEALKKFGATFRNGLSKKAIAAIRAATKLANGQITKVTTVLAEEERAALIEADGA